MALPKLVLGESPHWNAQTQSLYLVDIAGAEHSVWRYDSKENRSYGARIDGESHVSFIIPVAGTSDQFAVGLQRRVGVIQWDGKSSKAKLVRIAFKVEQSDRFKENVFNDGKADASGRLYAGTLRAVPAATFDEIFENRTPSGFFKYSVSENVVQLFDNMKLSNGLTWNVQKNKFYLVDSCDFDVKEVDYNPVTGHLSNKRIVIDFKDKGQRPRFLADGLTIDTEGKLYVALFNGSKILKLDPTSGKIEKEIELPAKLVTALTFGGPNLDILYVTTADLDLSEPTTPDAGHTFKVTGLGAKGFDGSKVRV